MGSGGKCGWWWSEEWSNFDTMTGLDHIEARACGGNYSAAHSVVIPSQHARPAKRCAAFFSEDDTRNRLRSGVYGTCSAEKACGKKASRSAGIACWDGISSIPQEHDLRSPEQLVWQPRSFLTISAPLSPSCGVGTLRRSTCYAAHVPPCMKAKWGQIFSYPTPWLPH